jgi:hypothetical protein
MGNKLGAKGHAAKANLESLNADELGRLVRDGLVSMEMTERAGFIRALDIEMRRAKFNIRAYLVPLGISGRCPQDLTPTEVGHLTRYLKMIMPKAVPAVERVITRYQAFAGKVADVGDRLAA